MGFPNFLGPSIGPPQGATIIHDFNNASHRAVLILRMPASGSLENLWHSTAYWTGTRGNYYDYELRTFNPGDQPLSGTTIVSGTVNYTSNVEGTVFTGQSIPVSEGQYLALYLRPNATFTTANWMRLEGVICGPMWFYISTDSGSTWSLCREIKNAGPAWRCQISGSVYDFTPGWNDSGDRSYVSAPDAGTHNRAGVYVRFTSDVVIWRVWFTSLQQFAAYSDGLRLKVWNNNSTVVGQSLPMWVGTASYHACGFMFEPELSLVAGEYIMAVELVNTPSSANYGVRYVRRSKPAAISYPTYSGVCGSLARATTSAVTPQWSDWTLDNTYLPFWNIVGVELPPQSAQSRPLNLGGGFTL